jgi:hypothetical protein
MYFAHLPTPEPPPATPDRAPPPVPPDQAPDIVPQEDPPTPDQPGGPPPMIVSSPGDPTGLHRGISKLH